MFLFGIERFQYFHLIFSCCLKVWLPYSRFSRPDKTDLKDFRHGSFLNFAFSRFRHFPNKYFPTDVLGFSWFLKYFGGPQVKNNGFWGSWTCPLGPKIMNMNTFGFLESESKKLFYGAFRLPYYLKFKSYPNQV